MSRSEENFRVAAFQLSPVLFDCDATTETAGHYSRPDILRLLIDRSTQEVVEEMTPDFEEISDDQDESYSR